jgi:glycerol uptake facilitator-like aquaporin
VDSWSEIIGTAMLVFGILAIHEQIYPRPGWVERWLKAVTRTCDWVEA